MSDDKTGAPAPKKKGGKMKKILFFLLTAVVIGGGGIGAGLWATQAGYLGQKANAKPVDPNMPKLVVRDGVDAPETIARGRRPDPRLYQASYYPIEETFTVNLRDTEEMVQLSVGVSTYYDEKVIQALELHEMAVRSSILLTISDQDALQISTPGGKKVLKKDLKEAINDVLEAKEGFGGVDDVYFTSFVIQ